jgi:hypothetical protein
VLRRHQRRRTGGGGYTIAAAVFIFGQKVHLPVLRVDPDELPRALRWF